jgi:serine/threonine protein kinase
MDRPPEYVGCYRLGALILETNTAHIYESFHPYRCEKLAVKCLKRDRGREKEIDTECQLMTCLSHESIIPLVDLPEPDADFCYLVIPYAVGGDAYNYLNDRGPMEESMACIVIGQVLQGVSYLHHQGVWHRDIKPENILLMDESAVEPRAVLADFGSAKRFPLGQMSTEHCVGTDNYRAPELLNRQPCMFQFLRGLTHRQ